MFQTLKVSAKIMINANHSWVTEYAFKDELVHHILITLISIWNYTENYEIYAKKGIEQYFPHTLYMIQKPIKIPKDKETENS